MNIIKIQNQLKGVPDNTLVGYVQNPTGQVPTYLALSELQRRKDMRQNYQANKPEEKSVAEDLVEEAQPGIAALPEGQPMMEAMAPQPEMPMDQMAQGGLADLDTGNMYDENNYANGGIVAFAKGGMPDAYGVVMPVVPTMDDMVMQTQEAQKAFGVDPDFYTKTLEESKTERLKELAEAKKMDQAQLLLAMGSAFAGTPTFGKALSVAGERAAPIVGAMSKNQREINNMYKMADRKSLEAQYAQARGDAAGAQKAISEKENLLLNAQLEEAKLINKKEITTAKTTSDATKREDMIKINAAKLGEQMFINAYPAGSVSNILGDDPGFIQFVRNLYTKNVENYLRDRVEAPIPSENQMRKMYDNYLQNKNKSSTTSSKPAEDKKPAAKLSGPDSLLNIPRPSNIQKIMDKAAALQNPNKRYITENTDEELNQPWDSVGQGLDDPDY
jgi:hypothetical protein